MNFYEFNLLITSDFSEEQVASFSENLISELKEYGDIIGEVDFKQRKLAYPINKENEAWLTVLLFSIKGEDKKQALNSIEKIFKEKKEILRYLILIKKEIVEKPKRREGKKKDAPKDTPDEANLEKVNQKVEELLKEEA